MMTKTSRPAVEVEVREHAASTPDRPLWRAVVTTARGRCYAAVYAGDKPSDDKVRRDWHEDRNTSRAHNWSPYCS